MSDVSSSTKAGPCTFEITVDTSVPSAKVTLYWTSPKVEIGSATLTESEASATIGGKYLTTKIEATITANWDDDTITYSLDAGGDKTSGTLITW